MLLHVAVIIDSLSRWKNIKNIMVSWIVPPPEIQLIATSPLIGLYWGKYFVERLVLPLSTVRLWGFILFHCHLCARSWKNFEIRQAASSNKLISAKDTRTSNIHASRETMRTRVQDKLGKKFLALPLSLARCVNFARSLVFCSNSLLKRHPNWTIFVDSKWRRSMTRTLYL